jgi:hypothetical protein
MILNAIKSGVKSLFGGKKPKRRTFASISYDKTRPDVINDYKKVDEDDENVAYRDDKTGKVRIGIRGTAGADDLLTDAKILAGTKIDDTDRFKRSETFFQRIKDKYKPTDIKLSGHSLGGGIVNRLSQKYDVEGSAYNPFLLDKSQISDKIKNVRSAFDPVSLAVAKDIKTDYSKIDFNPLKAHGIKQFD